MEVLSTASVVAELASTMLLLLLALLFAAALRDLVLVLLLTRVAALLLLSVPTFRSLSLSLLTFTRPSAPMIMRLILSLGLVSFFSLAFARFMFFFLLLLSPLPFLVVDAVLAEVFLVLVFRALPLPLMTLLVFLTALSGEEKSRRWTNRGRLLLPPLPVLPLPPTLLLVDTVPPLEWAGTCKGEMGLWSIFTKGEPPNECDRGCG